MTYSAQLAERAAEILGRIEGIEDPVIAEIGVATGNLAELMLRQRHDLNIVMVDNWRGCNEQPDHYKATNDSNSQLSAQDQEGRYQAVCSKMAPFGERVRIIRSDSAEAAALAPDGLDLVFVDADHSYEGCLRDLKAWWPKVKPGVWFGGHDYANNDPRFRFRVTEAVDEFLGGLGRKPELGANFTWWTRK